MKNLLLTTVGVCAFIGFANPVLAADAAAAPAATQAAAVADQAATAAKQDAKSAAVDAKAAAVDAKAAEQSKDQKAATATDQDTDEDND